MKYNWIRGHSDTYTLPLLAWQHKIENNVNINYKYWKQFRRLNSSDKFLTGKTGDNTEAKFLNLTDIGSQSPVDHRQDISLHILWRCLLQQ